jgi:hypothetical protein
MKIVAWLLAICPFASFARADDIAPMVADRLAVERVYYNHRIGTKPPFEQELPAPLAEKLVRQDLHKEAVLKKVYGVEVTQSMLDTERARIMATSRAPETLAELQAALGNDPVRFARTVARPIVVERILHQRFENDDQLHRAQRQEAEAARNELLTAKKNGDGYAKLLALLRRGHAGVTETIWQLGARLPQTKAPDANVAEVQKRFGANAQILSSPSGTEKELKFYFDELPADLQRVLQAQLRQAGDLSAVIETPNSFLLYLCKERRDESLATATLSIHKRSYEEWLAEQDTKD